MNKMRTYSPGAAEIESHWRVVDAAGKPLGRLATEIAQILQGKDKPVYASYILTGDHVIVINASKVRLTGKKLADKVYRWHTGFHGGLKTTSLKEMLEKRPERVIQHAVRGMLPHNKLGKKMFLRLKVYGADSHPHSAQTKVSQHVVDEKATQKVEEAKTE